MKSREIKFRVWDSVDKKFIQDINSVPAIRYDGTLFPYGTGHCAEYWKDRFYYQQYTALKDKTGKEIYEGDIVLCPDLNPPEYTNTLSIVEYHGSCWCYKDIHTNKVEPIWDFIGLSDMDADGNVIGNILENPDLIKSN